MYKHSLIPTIPEAKDALLHLKPLAKIPPLYCTLPSWWLTSVLEKCLDLFLDLLL